MSPIFSSRYQHGAVLVVGMIMLVLITLMVSAAFTLTSGNLQAVTNMQLRSQALAAANQAIRVVATSPFTTNYPGNQDIDIDLNNNGSADFRVTVCSPLCVRAIQGAPAAVRSGTGVDIQANVRTDTVADPSYTTEWDIKAVPAELSASSGAPTGGAKIILHMGVTIPLSDTQYRNMCLPHSDPAVVWSQPPCV